MRKNVEDILRNRVTIRLTDEQYGRLLDYSYISKLSVNKLVRELINRKVPKAMNPRDIQRLITAVDKIGTNINQISKVANTYHTISEGLAKQLVNDVDMLKKYILNEFKYDGVVEEDWYKNI